MQAILAKVDDCGSCFLQPGIRSRLIERGHQASQECEQEQPSREVQAYPVPKQPALHRIRLGSIFPALSSINGLVWRSTRWLPESTCISRIDALTRQQY